MLATGIVMDIGLAWRSVSAMLPYEGVWHPMDSVFHCAYCFEPNSIFVEPDGGSMQRYVEDCQVCCRPNRLFITWDELEEIYIAESEPEN